jgi:hypothetical protein
MWFLVQMKHRCALEWPRLLDFGAIAENESNDLFQANAHWRQSWVFIVVCAR